MDDKTKIVIATGVTGVLLYYLSKDAPSDDSDGETPENWREEIFGKENSGSSGNDEIPKNWEDESSNGSSGDIEKGDLVDTEPVTPKNKDEELLNDGKGEKPDDNDETTVTRPGDVDDELKDFIDNKKDQVEDIPSREPKDVDISRSLTGGQRGLIEQMLKEINSDRQSSNQTKPISVEQLHELAKNGDDRAKGYVKLAVRMDRHDIMFGEVNQRMPVSSGKTPLHGKIGDIFNNVTDAIKQTTLDHDMHIISDGNYWVRDYNGQYNYGEYGLHRKLTETSYESLRGVHIRALVDAIGDGGISTAPKESPILESPKSEFDEKREEANSKMATRERFYETFKEKSVVEGLDDEILLDESVSLEEIARRADDLPTELNPNEEVGDEPKDTPDHIENTIDDVKSKTAPDKVYSDVTKSDIKEFKKSVNGSTLQNFTGDNVTINLLEYLETTFGDLSDKKFKAMKETIKEYSGSDSIDGKSDWIMDKNDLDVDALWSIGGSTEQIMQTYKRKHENMGEIEDKEGLYPDYTDSTEDQWSELTIYDDRDDISGTQMEYKFLLNTDKTGYVKESENINVSDSAYDAESRGGKMMLDGQVTNGEDTYKIHPKANIEKVIRADGFLIVEKDGEIVYDYRDTPSLKTSME